MDFELIMYPCFQFTMEMAGSDVVNMPKSYSLNMSKDFVPMGIFSDSNQGAFFFFFYQLSYIVLPSPNYWDFRIHTRKKGFVLC